MKSMKLFGGIRNGIISCLKSTVARAMDRDPEGFAEAQKRLEELLSTKTKNVAPPTLPPKGSLSSKLIPPEKSLGVIQGYDG